MKNIIFGVLMGLAITANITVRADQEDYNRGLLDARIQYAQQLQEQYNSNSRTSPLIHSTSYNQITPIRTDIIRNIPSNLINSGISYGSIRLSDEFQNQMTKW